MIRSGWGEESKEHGNSYLLNSYTTIEGLSYCGNKWGKKMLLVPGAGDHDHDHGGVNHDGKPQPHWQGI